MGAFRLPPRRRSTCLPCATGFRNTTNANVAFDRKVDPTDTSGFESCTSQHGITYVIRETSRCLAFAFTTALAPPDDQTRVARLGLEEPCADLSQLCSSRRDAAK